MLLGPKLDRAQLESHSYSRYLKRVIVTPAIELSARPDVRGTADTDGGAYSPSVNSPRTHSRLSHHPVLRTDRQ